MKLGFWLGGPMVGLVVAHAMGCIGAPFTTASGTGGTGGSTSSSATTGSTGGSGTGGTGSVSVSVSSGAGGKCAPPSKVCGQACVDVTKDADNCGDCAHACGPNTSCVSGSCVCQDPVKSFYCAAPVGCVDPSLPDHCNNCAACPHADDTCVNLQCICASGDTDCGGACVDLKRNPANCGGCGKPCTVDEACLDGTCVCRGSTVQCPVAGCVDIQHAHDHCGSCLHGCGVGKKCDGGACLDGCDGGKTECNGGCYDSFDSDPANCGQCGHACDIDQVCVGGSCQAYFFPNCASCQVCNACGANSSCCPEQFDGINMPVPACVAGGSCG